MTEAVVVVPMESFAWTQKVVVDVNEAVVYGLVDERDPPEGGHAPEYQA